MTALPIYAEEIRRVPMNEYRARKARLFPPPMERVSVRLKPVMESCAQAERFPDVRLADEPQMDGPAKLSCPVEGQSLHKILHEVARQYGFKISDLRAQCQNKRVCAARKLFYYRAVSETELSYPAIGRFIGRDHTSIIHGVQSYCLKTGAPRPRGLQHRQQKYRYQRKRGGE